MSFIDKLKHAVVDDDSPAAAPAKPAAPVIHAVPVAPLTAGAPTNGLYGLYNPGALQAPAADLASTNDDNGAYKRLLALSDFQHTTLGAVLHSFMQPLETLIPDERLRFKAALQTAVSQGKVDAGQLLGVFDALLADLQNQATAFASIIAEKTSTEVTRRTQDIHEAQQQISQLQQKSNNLSIELAKANSAITQAQGQFTAALQRRTAELTQQKQQFASMMEN